MKSAILPACAILLAVLPSCTPAPMAAQPPVQRERLAYLTRTADVPVTCTAGADCTEKWARALQWVTAHSVYSVKTHTDSEIATNGPIEPTTDAAFTVSKTQDAGGSYEIRFSSSCGKEAPACVPTTLELHSQFNNFVLYGQ